MSLYEQERLGGAIATAYTFAAVEYAYVANAQRTQKYARLAWEANLLWRGPLHHFTQLMESMAEVPEGFRKWNWTAKLKAAPVLQLQPEDVKVIPKQSQS